MPTNNAKKRIPFVGEYVVVDLKIRPEAAGQAGYAEAGVTRKAGRLLQCSKGLQGTPERVHADPLEAGVGVR